MTNRLLKSSLRAVPPSYNGDHNVATDTSTARNAAAGRPTGYPAHLVRSVTLPGGATVVIRPIVPEDAVLEQEFPRVAPHHRPVKTPRRVQDFHDDVAAEAAGVRGPSHENTGRIRGIGCFDGHRPIRVPVVDIRGAADDELLFHVTKVCEIQRHEIPVRCKEGV